MALEALREAEAPAGRRRTPPCGNRQEAARRNEEIGVRPFPVRTWLDQAGLRAAAGARGEARELARAALEAANGMGMARVARQAEGAVAAAREPSADRSPCPAGSHA